MLYTIIQVVALVLFLGAAITGFIIVFWPKLPLVIMNSIQRTNLPFYVDLLQLIMRRRRGGPRTVKVSRQVRRRLAREMAKQSLRSQGIY